jgi:hypothetical protein
LSTEGQAALAVFALCVLYWVFGRDELLDHPRDRLGSPPPPRRSRYGKALFLAMAWGSSIGGVATLLGGGRAPVALGILKEVGRFAWAPP